MARYLVFSFFVITNIILSAGCKNHVNQYNIDSTNLVRKSRVKIDESEVVLKTIPNASILIGQDSLLSIVDYNSLVLYNTSSGKMVYNVSIDSIMDNSNFDVLTYIRRNCEGIYKNRAYAHTAEEVKSEILPRFKILSLPSKVADLRSVNVVVGILTPYRQPLKVNGNIEEAVFLDNSIALLNVDILNKKITRVTHIKTDLLNSNKASSEVFFPFFESGSHLKNGILMSTISANPDKHIPVGEKVAFDLNSQHQKIKIINSKYPEEYYTKYNKSILMLSFYEYSDNTLYYNSLFDIYDITDFDNPKLAVSLRKEIDMGNLERINSFKKVNDNIFLIQTLVMDSSRSCSFRFYDVDKKQLSLSKLKYASIAAFEYVVYTPSGFIKFSKDNENSYFEKYDIFDSTKL